MKESPQIGQRLGPESPSGIKRVHVGCGPHAIMASWWNVDIRKFPGIDEAFDATQPWPYEDLEFIYAEHFLEHLRLDKALLFLTHAGNSLREGGVLRLSTPNLEWVVHTHFQTGPVGLDKRLMDTLWINRAFHGWGHQFLYSPEMLHQLLSELGYCSLAVCTHGESRHPALMNIEKHGKYSVVDGFPSVVILEATRGPSAILAPPKLQNFILKNFLRQVIGGH